MPSRYFDGELTDGDAIIRVVGFDKAKRQELKSFCDYGVPVTLRNCLIQQNKYKQSLEVVLKSHTKIEPSEIQFNVPNLKTVGSSLVQIDQLSQHERVNVKVSVIKVNEAQTVPGGKVKEEVIVADSTGKATVTLWVTDVGLLKQHKSYQLNRLEIRYYQGKHHLSFPSAASVDEISDVEDVIEPTNSDEDNDEEQLLNITISSIRQLETIHMCVNCKKVFAINSHMGECNACSTTQKLPHPKQTTKLIIESGTKILTLMMTR